MHSNAIEFVVYGNYALFTDPLTKIGGEKMSYQIPTYQSLKGIIESIYWKPTLIYYVDEIRVMNQIRMESKGIRPLNYYGGNQLANYTYLKEVKYEVRAHFEFNPYRPDLTYDHNENKHHNILKRALKVGGRRDIFLGTRECQAYVEPCEFGKEESFYAKYGELTFGTMVHGLNYPDETNQSHMEARLWNPVMKDGTIRFIRPEQCTLVRKLSEITPKIFNPDNLQSADELLTEWEKEDSDELAHKSLSHI